MNRQSPDDMKKITMAEQRTKIEELKKELNILKKRVERNDAIIDELLVAEEWTDIQWILEKEYEFSPF